MKIICIVIICLFFIFEGNTCKSKDLSNDISDSSSEHQFKIVPYIEALNFIKTDTMLAKLHQGESLSVNDCHIYIKDTIVCYPEFFIDNLLEMKYSNYRQLPNKTELKNKELLKIIERYRNYYEFIDTNLSEINVAGKNNYNFILYFSNVYDSTFIAEVYPCKNNDCLKDTDLKSFTMSIMYFFKIVDTNKVNLINYNIWSND